jgi:hypothetical protein
MLDRNDLQSIREIFREELRSDGTREFIFEVVGDVLEQVVLPQIQEVRDEITGIKGEINGIKGEINGIKGEINGIKGEIMEIRSTMVTKDYLEDRLADFKATLKATGGQALRQIKLMAAELHHNGGLSAEQVVQITTA